MRPDRPESITFDVIDPDGVDEVFIGFVIDGETHKLATLEPPATASIDRRS